MSFNIGSATVEVAVADLTQMAVEAIVNSANTHFWMGGGLANAIKKAGGQEIEDEAIRQGPVDIGQAIITGAGELKARHVIHAVVMGQDLKTDEDNIRKASRSAFQLAEEKGIQSIGLPAMGTGVGGVSIFTSASVMIDEAISFLIDSEHIQHVTFALVDEEGREAFHAELLSRFSKGKS